MNAAMLEALSIGSQVRDLNGEVWTRNERGWRRGIAQASSEWLHRHYCPLVEANS